MEPHQFFIFYYNDDAHAPYTVDRVSAAERIYAEHPIEDVFFALHRRADATSESLASFFPPSPPAAATYRWKPEHGFVVYFGDHGEVLKGNDPPPHGNLVSADVAEVFILAECRVFAKKKMPGISTSIHRLVDIYTTVADVVGLSVRGPLYKGKSFLGGHGHDSVVTFSFYRPSERAAVHYSLTEEKDLNGRVDCHAEFERGPMGWALVALEPECRTKGDIDVDRHKVLVIAGRVVSDASSVSSLYHVSLLREALLAKEDLNALFTESNVHVAWLVATIAAAAAKAKAVMRHAFRILLAPAFLLAGYISWDEPEIAPANASIFSEGDKEKGMEL